MDEPDNPARSLVVSLPGDGGPAVALLGHPDTVFAAGTTAGGGSRASGDRCTGPGVADMKGGLVLAAMAMERLAELPQRPFSELRLLVCADEEVRLRAPAAADHARGAAAALVFECGRRNGDLVSARKGALWRTLHAAPAAPPTPAPTPPAAEAPSRRSRARCCGSRASPTAAPR